MSYRIECKDCKEIFTKATNASTETRCPDCIYKSHWAKSRNLRAAIGNEELTKTQILKKMNKIDERIESFNEVALKETITILVAKEINTQTKSFESTIQQIADKAGMSYSEQFKELKVTLEAIQKEHEARMKTLLATVNTNFIAAQNKVTERLQVLGNRVTNLRAIAKKKGWAISLTRDANGTLVKE